MPVFMPSCAEACTRQEHKALMEKKAEDDSKRIHIPTPVRSLPDEPKNPPLTVPLASVAEDVQAPNLPHEPGTPPGTVPPGFAGPDSATVPADLPHEMKSAVSCFKLSL